MCVCVRVHGALIYTMCVLALHTLVLDCGHDVRYVICSTKDSVSGCSATCVTSSCGGAVDCENSAHTTQDTVVTYTLLKFLDKVTFCHDLNIGESTVVFWNKTKVLQEEKVNICLAPH